MSEIEYFKDVIKDKSANTIKSYVTQYKKLYKLLNKNIADTTQNDIMEIVMNVANANSRQALLNIAIIIHTAKEMDVSRFLKYRETLKKEIKELQKQNNIVYKETLPTYDELVDYTQNLIGKNNLFFVINYLLLNYYVRNEDLLFHIVTRKKDTEDESKNYLHLSKGKVIYIRNVYKTAKLYGRKENEINDKDFVVAVSKLKREDFEPLEMTQMPYLIKKATLLGIGEGSYVKIVINHFRNDIDKLKEISKYRGTSLNTLLESYDIDNKDL